MLKRGLRRVKRGVILGGVCFGLWQQALLGHAWGQGAEEPQQLSLAAQEVGPPLAAGPIRSVLFTASQTYLVTLDGLHILRWYALSRQKPRRNASSTSTATKPEKGDQDAFVDTGKHQALIAVTSSVGDGVFTGGADGTVHLWQPNNPLPVRSFFLGNDGISSLLLAKDQQSIIGGSVNGLVSIWSNVQQLLTQRFQAHDGAVKSMVLHPDGLRLFTAGEDRAVSIWLWREGRQTRQLRGLQGEISSIALVNEGRVLAVALKSGLIRLWRWQTGEETLPSPEELKAPTHLFDLGNPITSVAAHPFGWGLISADESGNVHLWDSRRAVRPRRIVRHEDIPLMIALDRRSARMALGLRNGGVGLWRLDPVLAGFPSSSTQKNTVVPSLVNAAAQSVTQMRTALLKSLQNPTPCENTPLLYRQALAVLKQDPGAAEGYYALLLTAMTNRDWSMARMAALLGREARLPGPYNAFSARMENAFHFWNTVVFDSSYLRGTKPQPQINWQDCNGKTLTLKPPREFVYVDLPQNVLQALISPSIRWKIERFYRITPKTFVQQIHQITWNALENLERAKRSGLARNLSISTKLLGGRPALLQLDLQQLDPVGNPKRVPFSLRWQKGPWLYFITDSDKQKHLLLPPGQWRLRVGGRVHRVFSLAKSGQLHIILK